ncbi:hypothetical protein T492DRAFT_157169 [Pavlovales sp. CCMP2436]|nr:hypothetical protein T492DRAFT_157169 [Pavlovales sp. CCMP2436]
MYAYPGPVVEKCNNPAAPNRVYSYCLLSRVPKTSSEISGANGSTPTAALAAGLSLPTRLCSICTVGSRARTSSLVTGATRWLRGGSAPADEREAAGRRQTPACASNRAGRGELTHQSGLECPRARRSPAPAQWPPVRRHLVATERGHHLSADSATTSSSARRSSSRSCLARRARCAAGERLHCTLRPVHATYSPRLAQLMPELGSASRGARSPARSKTFGELPVNLPVSSVEKGSSWKPDSEVSSRTP